MLTSDRFIFWWGWWEYWEQNRINDKCRPGELVSVLHGNALIKPEYGNWYYLSTTTKPTKIPG